MTKKFRNGVQAVRGVSLHAEAGEIIGIVGPNGAGKSTTLKMLATLLRPTSGTARVGGIPIGQSGKIRPLLGIALQEVGLDPLMTGSEHFVIQAALTGIKRRPADERTAQLVDRLDLGPYMERQVGSYSGGTQRRLALALALLADPEVVILDEPTSGLDPRARRDIWLVVEELKEAGRTLLFSTQYLEEADAHCDRIYLIDKGVIVAQGAPEDLKRAIPGVTLRLEMQNAADQALTELISSLPVQIERMSEVNVVLRLDDSEQEPARLVRTIESHGYAMSRFSVSSANLDDVFIHHTRRPLEPEPEEKAQMDLGTRMHRGGGKRWK